MDFGSNAQFMVAAAFMPSSESNEFNMSPEGDQIKLQFKAPLLLYVKELKKMPYLSKYGVLMNQRFYDPTNRYSY